MEEHEGNLVLITGAARSGKSVLAESLAAGWKQQVHYVATMNLWPEDKEGVARIERHRRRRPPEWLTHEIPSELDLAIRNLPRGPAVVLLDCLSLYVSNLLLSSPAAESNPYESETHIAEQIDLLADAIAERNDLNFIVVTNEVGWGVIPERALGRAYRDFLGTANQLFASRAGTVWLTCSGLKTRLKP